MMVRRSVERLYDAEREAIYAYLLQLGVPAQRAQELAQDAFLKLYLCLSAGEAIDNPRAWLYRVAHNLAMKWHGREARFRGLDECRAAPEPSLNPEQSLLERERRTRLNTAIGALSPQQKNCLHLRARGLRYREIAQVAGISTSAVGEFLRRAVTRLKEAMHG
jgi:RNA polymerase sigma-70 factor (ECF subfamily)